MLLTSLLTTPFLHLNIIRGVVFFSSLQYCQEQKEMKGETIAVRCDRETQEE
jgi:hypothetical protein